MDSYNRHPLDCITRTGSLSMLECLIPFVEYPLKLPLALLIKYNEIQLILKAFQSIDNLSRFGLHSDSATPTDMLCAITGIPPNVLNLILSMQQSKDSSSNDLLRSLFSNSGIDPNILSAFTGQKTSPDIHGTTFEDSLNTIRNQDSLHTKDTHSDSFDYKLSQILAEYDMQEAEHFASSAEKQED